MLNAVLAIVFALQTAAPQQRDTRTWYQAYADAQRNIQQRNWQAAIADIEAASRLGAPKPGRNVLFYGDVYRDYNPDYYLGLAYVNLQRFAEADSAFERVKQAQLINNRDSLFAEFTRQAGVAKDASQKLAQAKPGAAPNPTTQKPADVPLPPNVAQTAPNAQASRGVNPAGNPPSTNAVVAPNNAAAAPNNAAAAPNNATAGAPAPRPAVPDPKLAAAAPRPNPPPTVPTQARPTAVAGPTAPVPAPARTPAPAAAAPLDERAGVLQFFSGDYESAAASLALVTYSPGASPRAYFYLACSRAAMVLTGKAPRTAIDDARAQLLLARDTGQFAADKRLISPRIRFELGMQP